MCTNSMNEAIRSLASMLVPNADVCQQSTTTSSATSGTPIAERSRKTKRPQSLHQLRLPRLPKMARFPRLSTELPMATRASMTSSGLQRSLRVRTASLCSQIKRTSRMKVRMPSKRTPKMMLTTKMTTRSRRQARMKRSWRMRMARMRRWRTPRRSPRREGSYETKRWMNQTVTETSYGAGKKSIRALFDPHGRKPLDCHQCTSCRLRLVSDSLSDHISTTKGYQTAFCIVLDGPHVFR